MKDINKETLSLQCDTKPQGGRASGIWRRKPSGTGVKPGPQQDVSVNERVLLQARGGHVAHLAPKSELQRSTHLDRETQDYSVSSDQGWGREASAAPQQVPGNSGNRRRGTPVFSARQYFPRFGATEDR